MHFTNKTWYLNNIARWSLSSILTIPDIEVPYKVMLHFLLSILPFAIHY